MPEIFKIDIWRILENKIQQLIVDKDPIKLKINTTDRLLKEWINDYITKFNKKNNNIVLGINYMSDTEYSLYVKRYSINNPVCTSLNQYFINHNKSVIE